MVKNLIFEQIYEKEAMLVYLKRLFEGLKRHKIVFLAGLFTVSSGILYNTSKNTIKTYLFIKNLDIPRYERNGSDFTSPRYSPSRLKKPLENIDEVCDYDFELLDDTYKKLDGLDRQKVSRHLFDSVTRDAKTPTEKHIAVLKFLQKSSVHNPILQPMHRDKRLVTDPLVLLELGEMRCGQIARLAVDIFSAAGYKGRLVQLGGHVIAEIFYDSSWHYFDADIFGNGSTILDEYGNVPSVVELSKNPYLIDALPSYMELSLNGYKTGKTPYPSYFYFSKEAYGEGKAVYYVKTATKKKERNKHYGWNDYITINDSNRRLYPMKMLYTPSIPIFSGISVCKKPDNSRWMHIEWDPSSDPDDDLVGYRVYVSKTSRGWSYSKFSGH